MNLLERIMSAIRSALTAEITGIEPEERAVSIQQVYDSLWGAIEQLPDDQWFWPVDVFIDEDSSVYAVVAKDGKLYRMDAMMVDGGVSFGAMVEVAHQFTPVSQSITVHRQADGKLRWFMIAGTAVLNRNGEVDTRQLFDNFIARAEASGLYPKLDFFHLGGANDYFEFGQADYLARDGVVYLASGLFDDSEFGEAMARAIESEPGFWGASIEFLPLESELWEAAPDVRVRAYTDGINLRISVLPEKDACALFTQTDVLSEVTRMDKRIKEALQKVFGEDEDRLRQLEQMVDGVNRSTEEQGLVHREAEAEDVEDAVAEEVELEPVLELDDEAIDAIAGLVAQKLAADQAAALAQTNGALEGLTKTLGELQRTIAKDSKRISKLAELVDELAAEDDERLRTRIEDTPRQRIQVQLRRPRVARAEEVDEEDAEFEPDLAGAFSNTSRVRA